LAHKADAGGASGEGDLESRGDLTDSEEPDELEFIEEEEDAETSDPVDSGPEDALGGVQGDPISTVGSWPGATDRLDGSGSVQADGFCQDPEIGSALPARGEGTGGTEGRAQTLDLGDPGPGGGVEGYSEAILETEDPEGDASPDALTNDESLSPFASDLEPVEIGPSESSEETDTLEEPDGRILEEPEVDLKAGNPGDVTAPGDEPADFVGQGLRDETSDHLEEVERARILAEHFNEDLGDMDRFFNRYVLVPAGEYKVGGRSVGKGERPEKTVRLPPFCIGKFPVTNALFEIFVEKTGYRTTAERLGHGTVYVGRCRKVLDERSGLESWIWSANLVVDEVQGACWYQPSGPGSTLHKKRNHPVVQLSLEDAMAFAAWTGTARFPADP
jgi:hypothetical protein